MEHLPKGSALLRLWYVKSEEQICLFTLIWVTETNVLTEKSLQGLGCVPIKET